QNGVHFLHCSLCLTVEHGKQQSERSTPVSEVSRMSAFKWRLTIPLLVSLVILLFFLAVAETACSQGVVPVACKTNSDCFLHVFQSCPPVCVDGYCARDPRC